MVKSHTFTIVITVSIPTVMMKTTTSTTIILLPMELLIQTSVLQAILLMVLTTTLMDVKAGGTVKMLISLIQDAKMLNGFYKTASFSIH